MTSVFAIRNWFKKEHRLRLEEAHPGWNWGRALKALLMPEALAASEALRHRLLRHLENQEIGTIPERRQDGFASAGFACPPMYPTGGGPPPKAVDPSSCTGPASPLVCRTRPHQQKSPLP